MSSEFIVINMSALIELPVYYVRWFVNLQFPSKIIKCGRAILKMGWLIRREKQKPRFHSL